jgi:hypothetical protein
MLGLANGTVYILALLDYLLLTAVLLKAGPALSTP